MRRVASFGVCIFIPRGAVPGSDYEENLLVLIRWSRPVHRPINKLVLNRKHVRDFHPIRKLAGDPRRIA